MSMGRPRKKPDFDPDKVMKELIDVIGGIYAKTGELSKTAEEIGLSPIKVKKILITGGLYENDTAKEVLRLYEDGHSPFEIQEITGLGKSAVNGYLPYTKAPYRTNEVSLNAERIRIYRKRQAAVERLKEDMSEESLWEAVVLFQGY